MRYLDHDMATVFFDEFALRFTRERAQQPALDISGILGIEDVEALEERVAAARRTLLLPAGTDVRPDDVLVALAADGGQRINVGDRFMILDAPRRVNDGAVMEVLLGSA